MTTAQDEIAVEPADLRSDAALWREAAGKLASAQASGRAQNPPNSAFMLNGMLVAEAYRDLASQLLARMGDGHAQFYGLSTALTEIAEAYEQYEDEVVNIVHTTQGKLDVEDA